MVLKLVKLLLLILLTTGCVKQPGSFSGMAEGLGKAQATISLEKYKKPTKHIKIRELYKLKSLDKTEIDKMDQDRRHFRKLAIKLRDTMEAKNEGIRNLISVIELLEIENKINVRIAQKALRELEKEETKNMINDAFQKGMSLISILALVGII